MGRKVPFLIKLAFYFKFAFAAILVIILLCKLILAINKLKDPEMTFVSSTDETELLTYPSVTVCITMDTNFTGGIDRKEWLDPDRYNFSFPFNDIGQSYIGGFGDAVNFNDLNYLSKIGVDSSHFWTASIQGMFGEPAPCYTFEPRGEFKAGLTSPVIFRSFTKLQNFHNPF